MNIKKLIIIIILTFAITTIPAIFINYDISSLDKPFEIPKLIFPIVWSILYILMSISYYLVSNYNRTLKPYIIQLLLNSSWSIIFFGLHMYLLGFIIIIILLSVVIYLIIDYYSINKISSYLLIPYALWLIFASYLNISIYLLNM